MKSLNSGVITFIQCVIKREALAAKKISAELSVVLQDAVKIINYINPILLKLFRAVDSSTAGLQKPTNLTIYNSKIT